MPKVTPIKCRQPVPEVVDLLKELLALAEKGEIIGIAVASTNHGRCTASAYVIGEAAIADLHLALARCQNRLLNIE